MRFIISATKIGGIMIACANGKYNRSAFPANPQSLENVDFLRFYQNIAHAKKRHLPPAAKDCVCAANIRTFTFDRPSCRIFLKTDVRCSRGSGEMLK